MPVRKPGHFGVLLRVRKHQREMHAMTLARTQREIARTRREREEIAERQRDALTRISELARARFDAGDVRRYYQYERYLARRAVEKDAEIRALEQRAAEEREVLEEAMKRHKITEKLEERVCDAYAAHVRGWEQKESDEAASNRRAMIASARNTKQGPA